MRKEGYKSPPAATEGAAAAAVQDVLRQFRQKVEERNTILEKTLKPCIY